MPQFLQAQPGQQTASTTGACPVWQRDWFQLVWNLSPMHFRCAGWLPSGSGSNGDGGHLCAWQTVHAAFPCPWAGLRV